MVMIFIFDCVILQTSHTSDDPVAPNTQHINEQDAAAKTKPSELLDVLTQVPTNNGSIFVSGQPRSNHGN